jgi:hypothetical protein
VLEPTVLAARLETSVLRPIFPQNVIAVVWDFDKTLSPGYMQGPLFKRFGVDESTFWSEVNELPSLLGRRGANTGPKGAHRVNEENIYLNWILAYVRAGVFKNLSNELLRELGKDLEFFAGMPEALVRFKGLVLANPEYQKFEIRVEHYIVSTGLREMIVGSKVAPFVDGIWGCEFAEAGPLPGKGQLSLDGLESGVVSQIAYAIDNTSKTRAIFEINKGSNLHPEEIHVNSFMRDVDRRVPIENVIYIADGPSDIPVFSVVAAQGGRTYAVYPKRNVEAFRQVNELQRQGRVNAFGEADYSPGSHTSLWLETEIERIADRIVEARRSELRNQVGKPARHLTVPSSAKPPEERLSAPALVPVRTGEAGVPPSANESPPSAPLADVERVRAHYIEQLDAREAVELDSPETTSGPDEEFGDFGAPERAAPVDTT